MPSPQADVVIIGAGVSGLTTGILLAERDRRVLIRTSRRPIETTSAAAGALWDFGYASHPDIPRWGRRTYDEWMTLLGPGSGVCLVAGIGATRTSRTVPDDLPATARVTMCAAGELPPGFAAGWHCTLPVVDMPVYLGYLESRFLDAGGVIEMGEVSSFKAAFEEADTVVNCAGLGAADLVDGEFAMEPVQGELVVVANPGVEEFFAEYTDRLADMIYLLPQGDKLVLGGTADPGRRDCRHDDEIAAHIINRCAQIHPEVVSAQVLSFRVGVRPNRGNVRVEREFVDGLCLVHNYGHGGSGVTLSWGCAERVAELLGV
jgi:D-amino-acid oxidase